MTEVPLSKVCKIKNGFAFKSTEFKNQGAPLIRISSFEDGPVFFDDRTAFVDESYIDSKKDFLVEKGDILIALSGATTGKYGFYTLDSPSLLNQRVGIIKSGRSEKLNSRYFYHYLSILKSRILLKAGGAAQPNISTKQIGEFKIPLPPLATQKKIAAILDAADAHRQKTKQLLAKYDELAQSIFLDMFGDTWVNPKGYPINKLSEVVKPKKIITYGIVQAGENVKDGVPYIRTGDIKDGKIQTTGLRRTSIEIANSYERSKCQAGDIVMSIRATVGTIAFLPEELDGANLTQGTARISVDNERFNPLYIYHAIKSKGIQLKIERETKGATFLEITLTRLREIEIPIPPLSRQQEFDRRMNSIISQEKILKKENVYSENLFNSLLQKAFKGQLVK
ncbi:restriction endonuclease subunit S [Pararhodonellum marinum]|uniref:restriction endonuclease subunit S n=1 Tax=Pararhodonellum marinum TaxID=2755358 RepID=UPI00188E3F0C|nr:restriction endonuclease subunit S [Pararhodonellum marinum]